MIIYFETLGCSRNQVDSEIMMGRLTSAGHILTDDPSRAGVILVNTCGFISTASQEAVDVILYLARFKQEGCCERLIAAGCLAQRYKDDPALASSLPEVDVFLGTGACDAVVEAVAGRPGKPVTLFPDPGRRGFQDLSQERVLTTGPYAYVKVSEGCNRGCAFCIIPTLRGRQRSRPLEEICKEVSGLADRGVAEIILTAENTTDYGRDTLGAACFETVLDPLAQILDNKPEAPWLRFLYTHPNTLSPEVIRAAAAHDTICSYYDVPIQHSASRILKRMNRPYTREDLERLFKTIRDLDPGAAIRTTLITGFPGETDADFDDLLSFVKTVRFDHLGVFTYSDSTDLASHSLPDHVPEDVAEQRRDRIMQAQAGISESINQGHVGQVYEVLVEETPETGVYIGRTRFQAPEVDGVTFIYSDGLEINTRVRVRITDAYEYDIAGEAV